MYLSGKVRCYVKCMECDKRRVVYSGRRLSNAEMLLLNRLQEEEIYICGNTLFSEGIYRDKIVVREGLSCTSQIETSYYSGRGLEYLKLT